MTFFEALIGNGKLTSEGAARALAQIEGELSAMPARIRAAQLLLADVADMSDEEHVAALAELEALRREEGRLQKRAEKARDALGEILQAEAATALGARRDAAAKSLAAYAKLIAKYEKEAAALGATVAEMSAIEEEIAAVNREIVSTERAGRSAPDRIITPDEVYRREPDIITPERSVTERKVVMEGSAGRLVRVGLSQTIAGKLLLGPGQRIAEVTRTIPGRTRYGQRISSPTREVVLPPARVGAKKLWPLD